MNVKENISKTKDVNKIKSRKKNDIFVYKYFDDDEVHKKMEVGFDDSIARKRDGKLPFIFKKLPPAICFFGGTGSGKTNVLNFLYRHLLVHKYSPKNTYIISASLDYNDSLSPVIERMQKYDEVNGAETYLNNTFTDWNDQTMDRLEQVYEDNKKDKEELLFIYDDVLNIIPELGSATMRKSRTNNFITMIATESRHCKCTSLFLLHQATKNILLKNCGLFLIFETSDQNKVFNMVVRGGTESDVADIFNYAKEKSKSGHAFIVLNNAGSNTNPKKPRVTIGFNTGVIIKQKVSTVTNISKEKLLNFLKHK